MDLINTLIHTLLNLSILIFSKLIVIPHDDLEKPFLINSLIFISKLQSLSLFISLFIGFWIISFSDRQKKSVCVF